MIDHHEEKSELVLVELYTCEECGHGYDGLAQCQHSHHDSKEDYFEVSQAKFIVW